MNCFVGMESTVTIEVNVDVLERLANLGLNLSIRFSPDVSHADSA